MAIPGGERLQEQDLLLDPGSNNPGLNPPDVQNAGSILSGFEPRTEVVSMVTRQAERPGRSKYAGIVAAGLLAAACSAPASSDTSAAPQPIRSSADDTPNGSVEPSPQGSENVDINNIRAALIEAGFEKVDLDTRLGKNVWVRGDGMSNQKAEMIVSIGSVVNTLVLGSPIPVMLDGKEHVVTLSVPDADAPRAYSVYDDVGDSVTHQVFGKDGKIVAAVGAIYASNAEGALGAYVSATTELCQGLDMKSKGVNVLDAVGHETYRLLKEGVCNSLGALADGAALTSYKDYKDFASKRQFTSVANGHDLPATVFDKKLFEKAAILSKQVNN